MVPTLSLSKKLKASRTSILAIFSSGVESYTRGRAMDNTLEGREPILPGTAKITLIVPKGTLKEASLRDPNPAWPPCPLSWYKNCFNFPSLTSYSRWLHKVLQSFVVCPCSWWYWQWRFWLRLIGSPPILFGHLKYGSFLIFSKTWY